MPELEAIDGRCRVVIENVRPSIDDGRFPIKRTVGQKVLISADVFADGHDELRVLLLSRRPDSAAWHEQPMGSLGNDAWQVELELSEVGAWEYTLEGWVDAFDTWHRDLKKRLEADQDVSLDLRIGAELVGQAVTRATGADQVRLRRWHTVLSAGSAGLATYKSDGDELAALMSRHPDRSRSTRREPSLSVVVDCQRAGFSTWYELFPRSCADEAERHGTFRDCIRWLPRLAEMGFDVLYMPPIHPIGDSYRKGKNNALTAAVGDFGSPWAIGSDDGGHKAIHPLLGTLADFRELVSASSKLGIDVALDIAFQCSPDHPYVKQHPKWFRKRPDGTIQYAENPPKKYQDIYPFDFDTPDYRALWQELTDVCLYWCAAGVGVFRVDNPHTKPFAFWEYLIGEVKARYPATIFLAEAFTRPKIMYRLAKLGFSQSYTYFTWRNSKAEFIEYLTELTQTGVHEFFRPNLWPNTPDILPEHLQHGGRGAFVGRLVLAATLSSNYGIYGPAYENLDQEPREPGSEEYLDSEKYQLRHWDLDRPDGLHDVITRVNRARRENPALQSNESLRFHVTDNEQLLCYSKQRGSNLIVVVVNLNFHGLEHGHIELPLAELGIPADRPYQARDLLNDRTFTWEGPKNFVKFDPAHSVAHVLRIESST